MYSRNKNLWGLIICVLHLTLFSCNNEKNKVTEFVENSLSAVTQSPHESFNDFNIQMINENSDTTIWNMADTLFFEHFYLFSSKVDSAFDNQYLVSTDITVITDVDTLKGIQKIYSNVQILDDKMKIYLQNTALFKLFMYEGNLCNEIGKNKFSEGKFTESKPWFEIGMSNNVMESYYYLGVLERYKGDFKSAIKLLQIALANGYSNAVVPLSECYTFMGKRGKGIELLKIEAEHNNNSDAMVKLGNYYETYYKDFGYVPPEDATDTSSFYWHNKAAKLGNVEGMLQVARIYEYGINRGIDYDSAFYWYNKGANLRDPLSMIKTGRFYIEGIGTVKNKEKGLNLIKSAIPLNPLLGYFELGELYLNGIGVEKNQDKAIKYLKLAEENGSPEVKRILGDIYKNSDSI